MLNMTVETTRINKDTNVYLLSIPGMRESIQEGLNTSIEDCDEKLDVIRINSQHF